MYQNSLTQYQKDQFFGSKKDFKALNLAVSVICFPHNVHSELSIAFELVSNRVT